MNGDFGNDRHVTDGGSTRYQGQVLSTGVAPWQPAGPVRQPRNSSTLSLTHL